MFYAKNQGGIWVKANQAHKEESYYCPDCGQSVLLRQGAVMASHFAHKKACTNPSFSEGETAEHLKGKALLATWLAEAGYRYQLEAYLSDLKQRPDLLVDLPGRQLALEFQCSPLSAKKLAERTQGYKRAGLEVIWLVGLANSRLKSEKFAYALPRLSVYFLDVAHRSLYLLQSGAKKRMGLADLFFPQRQDLVEPVLERWEEGQAYRYLPRSFLAWLYGERQSVLALPQPILAQKRRVAGTHLKAYELLADYYLNGCLSRLEDPANLAVMPLVSMSDFKSSLEIYMATYLQKLLNAGQSTPGQGKKGG